MIIGLGKEINRSGFGEQSEAVQDFRRILLQLVDDNTRDRESNFDRRVFLDKLQQDGIRGQITLGGYTLNDIFVQFIIEISSVGPYIKEAQRAKSSWLVHLKIEYHIFVVCVFHC